jgi:hypothetical protein
MFTIDGIISELRPIFNLVHTMRKSADEVARSLQNPTYQEQAMGIHEQQINQCEDLIKYIIQDFLSFPPHHSRHFSNLVPFYAGKSYEDLVFIMTKFPEGESQADAELTRVINTVSKAIEKRGYESRTASGPSEYYPLLWDNVELHLLGCSKGVAIVEDRYRPELNPNVAMEWGWMRGMGKDILFLVENGFNRLRADWSGLIQHRFSWEAPENGIEQAINNWLPPKMK